MAMIEAYRIGVELVLGGDLAAGVEALIPGLTRLDGSLAQANAEAKALAAALGSVAATAPGIGQAAGAMERLCTAMASMNRAAAHWQPGGGMPTGNAATRRGDDGVVPVAKRPAAATMTMPTADDARSAAAATAATIPVVAARSAKNEVAADRRPPGPVSAGRSLVQVVQAVTPPSANLLVGPPALRGPVARASDPRASPMVLATAAAPGNVTAPVAVEVSRVVARPSTVTATRSPAVVEQALPTLTRPVPGVTSEPSARPLVTTDRKPATAREQATQFRDVVLPQLGGRVGTGQPRPRGSDAEPQVRTSLPTPPAAAAVMPLSTPVAAPQPPPVRGIPGIDRRTSLASTGTPPGIAWPNLAAAMVEAKKGPAAQAFAGPALPKVDFMRTPSAGSPRAVGGGPAPADGTCARGDAGRPGLSPTTRVAEPAALKAGLPGAPSYHPQGSQGGPMIQHVTYVQLDERTIARAVTRLQLRMMGGQVSGTLRPDPSIAPQYGAHLLEL